LLCEAEMLTPFAISHVIPLQIAICPTGSERK
jgi:hypothetical protein